MLGLSICALILYLLMICMTESANYKAIANFISDSYQYFEDVSEYDTDSLKSVLYRMLCSCEDMALILMNQS